MTNSDSERLGALRSDFLVHWTGRKIGKPLDDLKSRDYVDRLSKTLMSQKIPLFSLNLTTQVERDLGEGRLPRTIRKRVEEEVVQFPKTDNLSKVEDGKWLIGGNHRYVGYFIEREDSKLNVYKKTNGLWMKWQKLEISDRRIKMPDEYWPATCFTEVRLSNTLDHAKHYGWLGFAFSRDFVMKRYGAPMQYVAGVKELGEGAVDVTSRHYAKLLRALKFLECKTVDKQQLDVTLATLTAKNPCGFNKFIQGIGLEQFLKGELGEDRKPFTIFSLLLASVTSCAIFVKRMSDEGTGHKFQLLDEAEWRIPYTTSMERKQMIQRTGLDDLTEPFCKIPFTQSDLKVLILPDDKTRELALDDNGKDNAGRKIGNWLFEDRTNVPIIVTVKECLKF